MSLSNNIETYRDVEKYMNQALTHGGIKLTLPSAAAAIRWRQRAYNFRKLYREMMSEVWGNAEDPENRAKAGKSPWDGWVVRNRDNFILIEFESDPVVSVETLDGEPADIDDTVSATEIIDMVSGPPRPITQVIPGLPVDQDEEDKFSPARPLF